MHDIITDIIIAIYVNGNTIQTILLSLFFLPAPTFDFKQALHTILFASGDNLKKKKRFINSTEATGNTACSNANDVYRIYTRTKQKLDLCKQEIRSYLQAEHEPNLGHAESKNPHWERSWTAGLRYTDRDKLPQSSRES